MTNGALLSVKGLTVHFPVSRGLFFSRGIGVVRAVENVSLELCRGESLGLVGESGCGKSTLGRAVLQLVRPTSGEVVFDGLELTSKWSPKFGSRSWKWNPELRQLRKRMQIIFQDPYASLNPRMTVEDI